MFTLEKPDYRKAEKEALRLLRNAGVYEPPVDPIQIAQDLGVEVKFARFGGDSEAVSGFFDCDTNVIMVNKSEYPLRQTFTVAHELGHKVLHEEWAKSEDYKVLWRDPTKQSKDRREQEANAFAANLLMPRELMDEYYRMPIEQISRLFAVSVPAVKHRLSFLYGI